MRKTLAYTLMLAATLGLAACDKASENKAPDVQKQAEQAQDKMNEAAKENVEAAKSAAEEAATPAPAPEAAPKPAQ
ncbi:hypothetical protein NVV94_17765 [Pseudomonas sp. LS1212]|uniref:hypothetical protein n=1 Tax=Pseudomonas sp. LS1212 TaxID=2972478 RepID=UPI00215BCDBD|nr:hypothetical protein [Pseudomonas sp. LS1212]UVJ42470.1 hypothetical protein NVV94_17765 [Pseudomonas sp. LS1212]